MDIKKLYLDGNSTVQISKKIGIKIWVVRKFLKDAGVPLRSKSDGVRLAVSKGFMRGRKGIKRTFTDEWRQNIKKAKILQGELTAKGRSLKPSGYVEITRGEHKGRGEHVVLVQQMIGRRLFANECVHHKNGIRHDNRIENLEIMTRKEHCSLHAVINSKKRKRDEKGRYNNVRCK